MPKSNWTEDRLQRLYGHYNHKFWRGRLARFQVVDRSLASLGAIGLCEWKRKRLSIDVAAHSSDRQIRSTLLHEMAHAAAPSRIGHGYAFWVQIEHLLAQAAPVPVGCSEAPGMAFLGAEVVPPRLRRCRAVLARLSRRMIQQIPKHVPVHNITKAEIVDAFEDTCDRPWSKARIDVGLQYGLFDVELKPRNRWSQQVLDAGRKAHREIRAMFLHDQRMARVFAEQDAAKGARQQRS